MITENPSSLENFFLSAIFANAFDLSAYCAALSEAKAIYILSIITAKFERELNRRPIQS